MALDQSSCRTELDVQPAFPSILLMIVFLLCNWASWDLVNEMPSTSMLSDWTDFKEFRKAL